MCKHTIKNKTNNNKKKKPLHVILLTQFLAQKTKCLNTVWTLYSDRIPPPYCLLPQLEAVMKAICATYQAIHSSASKQIIFDMK